MVKESKGSSKKAKDGSGGAYQQFVSFLNSPVWCLPVMSFIEQRSIVFDKEQNDSSMYKDIHNEYKSMVDMLIECFCEDISMKPGEMAAVLGKDKPKQKANVDQNVLEPVLAAQDFDLFVHMMTRKNIELQLQALQMIEFMCGIIPAALQAEAKANKEKREASGSKVAVAAGGAENERVILIQVIKQSKEEHEKKRKQEKAKPAKKGSAVDDLETAMKESLAEKERLEHERHLEEQLVSKALQLSLVEAPPAVASAPHAASGDSQAAGGLAHSSQESDAYKPQAAEGKVKKAKTAAEIRALMKSDTGDGAAVADAVHARQQYLREQRDKLLTMKQEARQRAFAANEADSKRERPRTARAARSALDGRAARSSELGEDVLAARRALAAKLKEAVAPPQ